MKTLSTSRRSWSVRRTSSRTSSPRLGEPAEQRVGDGLRLLGDLLEHEVVVAALLGGARRPSRCGSPCRSAGAPSKSVISMPSGGDQDDLVLAQLDRLAGVLDERGDVAGEEVLAVAAADDERRVAPGADDRAGRVGVDGEQGERALQPAADAAHAPRRAAAGRRRRRPRAASRSSAASRCAAHSVSVSLANSTPVASSSARSLAKFSMMPLWITATRPSADRCGWALRSVGPPWVAQRVWPMPVVPGVDAVGRRRSASAFSRLASLPARFSVSSDAAVDDGHAGRVVAAVLQPAQPVEHDAQRRPAADVTHDPTHGRQRSRLSLKRHCSRSRTFAHRM